MAKVRTRKALLLTAILPLGLGLTACGDDDDGDDAASALTVTAVADGDNYSFEGLPATIEGGTVTMTLDNTDGGDTPHELQLLKVEEGTTFDDVKSDLLEGEDGATVPGLRPRRRGRGRPGQPGGQRLDHPGPDRGLLRVLLPAHRRGG